MKKIRIHCLQHVSFENLGCIENWIAEKQYEITYTKFFEEFVFPKSSDFDWLIILGGPMSVNDSEKFPWIIEEQKFIEKAIKEDKTVLGICLGSQLIASILGSKVYPNQEKEIGWFPISKVGNTSVLFSDINTYPVFHWHGETFDLPENTELLASSEACKNQAFQYKDKILGLQFHLEISRESLAKMVNFGKDEIIKSKYIQSPEEIMDDRYLDTNNQKMYQLLNYLELK